ncbi:hypothetical protein BY996DRAFT_4219007 [Phakopsora pachyrhizi]|nr:hypothetical protein BY996DRAFT_4219007 [Phakopsora pachyrhizi]
MLSRKVYLFTLISIGVFFLATVDKTLGEGTFKCKAPLRGFCKAAGLKQGYKSSDATAVKKLDQTEETIYKDCYGGGINICCIHSKCLFAS